jgi:hypothetical protein
MLPIIKRQNADPAYVYVPQIPKAPSGEKWEGAIPA